MINARITSTKVSDAKDKNAKISLYKMEMQMICTISHKIMTWRTHIFLSFLKPTQNKTTDKDDWSRPYQCGQGQVKHYQAAEHT